MSEPGEGRGEESGEEEGEEQEAGIAMLIGRQQAWTINIENVLQKIEYQAWRIVIFIVIAMSSSYESRAIIMW